MSREQFQADLEASEQVRLNYNVPLFAWAEHAREAIVAGLRDEVRAAAINPRWQAQIRAMFLFVLGTPRDAEMRAAIAELLEHDKAWVVHTILEALWEAPDPALRDRVERLLDDPRSVADMWWMERISDVAARVLVVCGASCDEPPLREWRDARRCDLESDDQTTRHLAVVALSWARDPVGLAALPGERLRGDPEGELGTLMKELGLLEA